MRLCPATNLQVVRILQPIVEYIGRNINNPHLFSEFSLIEQNFLLV